MMTTMEVIISLGTMAATLCVFALLWVLADVPRLIRHLMRRLRHPTPKPPRAP